MEREDTNITMDTGTQSRPDTGNSKSNKTGISEGTLDTSITEHEDDKTEESIESIVKSQIDDQIESLKSSGNQTREKDHSEQSTGNYSRNQEEEESQVEASFNPQGSTVEIPATGNFSDN